MDGTWQLPLPGAHEQVQRAKMSPVIDSRNTTTLVLIAESFPYDGAVEQTFLNPELEYLMRSFRVILVPQSTRGTRVPVPEGIEVDVSYAALRGETRRWQTALRALYSKSFWRDILSRLSILVQYPALKRLLAFAGGAEQTRSWLARFLGTRNLDPRTCLFYTYWLDSSSLGVGLAKRDLPGIRLVSRAHGVDLYESRHQPPYIPCRCESLELLDGLFPASDHGTGYLTRRYPGIMPLCETARLGVKDPGFTTAASADGTFRIVSCSFLVPVKRVDLLLEGIACAARQRPQQQFEWHHFGDGPLRAELERLASTLPENVRNYLPGYRPLADLMGFYRDNPIDVFVNVSQSEGTPVAVMEAISCGMPVVATAVGGNPEIVSERNGTLLSPNPDPDEIAAALLDFWDDPETARRKRAASRQVWNEKYNASRNFQAFVDRLQSIRGQA